MKLTSVFAVTLFAALASQAAFAINTQGVWKGSGKLSSNQGGAIECESMIVNIAHTATMMKVDSTFTCKGEQQNAPGGVLEIKNKSEIWANGKRVGTLTDNSLTMSSDNGERKLDTKSTWTQNEMKFNTVSTFPNGLVLTFTGTVRR